MSIYKLVMGLVGLLLASAVVVSAVVGVATIFAAPVAAPRQSFRRERIQLGLRARALAIRLPMAGATCDADHDLWFAAGLKAFAAPGRSMPPSTERGSEVIPKSTGRADYVGPPSSVMNSTPWADAV